MSEREDAAKLAEQLRAKTLEARRARDLSAARQREITSLIARAHKAECRVAELETALRAPAAALPAMDREGLVREVRGPLDRMRRSGHDLDTRGQIEEDVNSAADELADAILARFAPPAPVDAPATTGQATRVWRAHPDELRSLRTAALQLIESGTLRWRRHGIGVLQAYVREGKTEEVRLHVWSPRLMLAGISESGACHNHRFAMTSTVLAGKLNHVEIALTPDAGGDHQTFDFVHARMQTDENRASMRLTGDRYNVRRILYTLVSGARYTFERGAYHESIPVSDVVVTWVEKRDQRDERACALAPVGTAPVPAFGGDPLPDALIAEVLADARACLTAALSTPSAQPAHDSGPGAEAMTALGEALREAAEASGKITMALVSAQAEHRNARRQPPAAQESEAGRVEAGDGVVEAFWAAWKSQPEGMRSRDDATRAGLRAAFAAADVVPRAELEAAEALVAERDALEFDRDAWKARAETAERASKEHQRLIDFTVRLLGCEDDGPDLDAYVDGHVACPTLAELRAERDVARAMADTLISQRDQAHAALLSAEAERDEWKVRAEKAERAESETADRCEHLLAERNATQAELEAAEAERDALRAKIAYLGTGEAAERVLRAYHLDGVFDDYVPEDWRESMRTALAVELARDVPASAAPAAVPAQVTRDLAAEVDALRDDIGALREAVQAIAVATCGVADCPEPVLDALTRAKGGA